MGAAAFTLPGVRIEDDIAIPPGVGDLDAFRRWAMSNDFPEKGRIDYLQGTIEVDMSPERLQSHGQAKAVLATYVQEVVTSADLGQVFFDRARLTSAAAMLSCEPDVLFVSLESRRRGRARYRPLDPDDPDQLEIEGSADLVVEVVSKSSVGKDTKRLPPLYARAGVLELWLADARGRELESRIFHLHRGKYRPAAVDAKGFQTSLVLDRKLRLRREPWHLPNTWRFWVEEA